MKKASLFQVLFPFIVMAMPWIYLAFVWKDLPATIPTHFGITGTADKFGSKNEVVLAPVIMTVMGIFIYFLLRNIYKLDPKKKFTETNAGVMAKIATVTVLLLSVVATAIIYWTVNGKATGMNIFLCGISIFMAYLGNLFHSVKPNYFAGFRLPWTLESEDNWRKTHQLASKIWFIGGLALAIITLLLSTKAALLVFFTGMMIMVFIPVIYSYRLYKQSLK
jgi:uncharacterized membrane protein